MTFGEVEGELGLTETAILSDVSGGKLNGEDVLFTVICPAETPGAVGFFVNALGGGADELSPPGLVETSELGDCLKATDLRGCRVRFPGARLVGEAAAVRGAIRAVVFIVGSRAGDCERGDEAVDDALPAGVGPGRRVDARRSVLLLDRW